MKIHDISQEVFSCAVYPGDAFFDTILSLKYTVDENRNHWYPTDNKTTARIVHENYMELFCPTETA